MLTAIRYGVVHHPDDIWTRGPGLQIDRRHCSRIRGRKIGASRDAITLQSLNTPRQLFNILDGQPCIRDALKFAVITETLWRLACKRHHPNQDITRIHPYKVRMECVRAY